MACCGVSLSQLGHGLKFCGHLDTIPHGIHASRVICEFSLKERLEVGDGIQFDNGGEGIFVLLL